MSLQENFNTFSYAAGGPIGQYLMVTTSAALARTASLPAAGALTVGVTLNKATAAGQALTVANGGIVKVVAGAVVALGALVTCDAQGRAVAAATGNYAVGRAITAAAAVGEIIEVQWLGPWIAA